MNKKILLFAVMILPSLGLSAAEARNPVGRDELSRVFELRGAFFEAVYGRNHRGVSEILSLLNEYETAYIIRQSDLLEGETCLHFAVRNNDIRMVGMLLRACPKSDRFQYLSTVDVYGRTCFHVTAQEGFDGLYKVLKGFCPEDKQDELLQIRDKSKRIRDKSGRIRDKN